MEKTSKIIWKGPFLIGIGTVPIIGLFLWNWKIGLIWVAAAIVTARRDS